MSSKGRELIDYVCINAINKSTQVQYWLKIMLKITMESSCKANTDIDIVRSNYV